MTDRNTTLVSINTCATCPFGTLTPNGPYSTTELEATVHGHGIKSVVVCDADADNPQELDMYSFVPWSCMSSRYAIHKGKHADYVKSNDARTVQRRLTVAAMKKYERESQEGGVHDEPDMAQ